MKISKHFLALTSVLLTAVMILTACKNNVNPDPATNADSQSPVTNNLPASKGENELDGKTYADSENGIQFIFNGDTATMTSSNESQIQSMARDAASANTKGSVFEYAYDSDNKTLSFQIKSVFEGGTGSDYKKECEELENTYGTAKSILARVLQAESFQGFFEDAIKAGSNTLQVVIEEKIASYFNEQIQTLTSYLTTKYNSILDLSYKIEEEKLTLEQKFRNNLNDASSHFTFTGDTFEICINDYEKLIPFSIRDANGKTYIGVPKIDEDKKTISVDLYSELAKIREDPSSLQTVVSEKVTTTMEAIGSLQDSKTLAKIGLELLISGNSTTLDAALESTLLSVNLEMTYTIGGTADNPTLVITPTKVPASLSSVIQEGSPITLEYTPFISYELTEVASLKVN